MTLTFIRKSERLHKRFFSPPPRGRGMNKARRHAKKRWMKNPRNFTKYVPSPFDARRRRPVKGCANLVDYCPVCAEFAHLDRHHLKPQAVYGNGKTIRICRRCHELCHRIWGPGDDYIGPTRADEFVCELAEVLIEETAQRLGPPPEEQA